MNIYILSFTFLLFVIAGLVKILIDTSRGKKSVFYYNTTSLKKCSKCGSGVPAFRIPKNLHQIIYGGWTCRECGGEFNRFGEELKK